MLSRRRLRGVSSGSTAYRGVCTGRRTGIGARRRAGQTRCFWASTWAERGTLSVFWLLERVGDTLYTREIAALKNVPFSQQEAELHRFLRLPNLRRALIDQSGLGRQFAERAAERYGGARVGGVTFTAGVKEALAYPLKARFEDAK